MIAFLHKSRIATNKVNANLFCCTVHRKSKWCVIISSCCCSNNCNGCYRNTFVYNFNTEFMSNLVTYFNKFSCFFDNFLIDFFSCFINISIDTIKKTDSHCYCANVEILFFNHRNCFFDILNIHYLISLVLIKILLTEIFFVLSVKILLNKSHLLANFFLSVNYNLCMALKIASF